MSQYGVAYKPLEPGDGPGAKQSMREECDVNKIVERYVKTGLIDHLADGIPQFVDVAELGDYRSVIEQVRAVELYFAGLPALVRRSFEDDARLFMDYLETNPSEEDLELLGLAAIGDRRAVERIRRAGDEPVVEEPEAPPEAPVEPGTVPT